MAALVNNTVDDKWGDSMTGVLPIYTPDKLWNQGATCAGCSISRVINPRRPFDRTWHDATYQAGSEDVSITITFTGTAVYVYNILANSIPSAPDATTLEFYVDDENVGVFTHSPDFLATDRTLYNVPVYVNDTLSNTAHTLFMNAVGEATFTVLFDYIVYTFNDSSGPLLSSTLPLAPSGVLPTVHAGPPIQPEPSTATAAPSTTSESSAILSTTSALSTTPPAPSISTIPHASPNTTSFTKTSSHSITQYPHATSILPSNVSSAITSHPASPSSLPHGRSRDAVIAGVTGGGIAVSLFVSIGIWYLRRRARRRQPNCVVDHWQPAYPTTSGHEFLIEPERGSQSVLDIGFSSPLQEAQYRARNPSAGLASNMSSGVLAVVGTAREPETPASASLEGRRGMRGTTARRGAAKR